MQKKMESNFIVKTTFRARPVTLSTPAHSSRRELCAEGYNVAVRGLKRLQNFILLFIFSFVSIFPFFIFYTPPKLPITQRVALSVYIYIHMYNTTSPKDDVRDVAKGSYS